MQTRRMILAAGLASDTAVTRVGSITAAPGLRLVDARGEALDLRLAGFDHFASA